jgi:hypothetical protein
MCIYENEHITHPLEFRVKLLERYLEEAIDIIAAKARPSDGCLMNAWIDEAMAVLNHQEVE